MAKIFRIPPKKYQQIRCIELDETYANISELAALLETSVASIYKCLTAKNKYQGMYNGRHFEFLGK